MPGAEDEHALPGLDVRRPDGAQRVAAGLDERGGGDAHVLGDLVRESRGDQHLLGERPGPAVADADLEPVRADPVMAGEAVLAVAAAEHRVTGDPLADPCLVGGVADRDHPAGPLVAEADGKVVWPCSM